MKQWDENEIPTDSDSQKAVSEVSEKDTGLSNEGTE